MHYINRRGSLLDINKFRITGSWYGIIGNTIGIDYENVQLYKQIS